MKFKLLSRKPSGQSYTSGLHTVKLAGLRRVLQLKTKLYPSESIIKFMDADVGSVQLPWWQKIRWRQYSRSEALEAERSLLALAE